MRRLCALLGAVLSIGCGGSEDARPAAPAACSAPKRAIGGRCLEPGVADDGCAAGTLALEDGSCQPAGIPPEMCGEGFVPDGDVGCNAVLPAEPCAPGSMAVPGDDACRPVMACGTGKWGDIPYDGETAFVDQSFAGASDGSIAAPWKTIGDAVVAAPAGGLVAVAEGTYAEDVVVADKAIHLRGVCPDRVTLAGTAAGTAALFVRDGASGTEVRGFAIRGGALGVLVSGSKDVSIGEVWVHDCAAAGIHLEPTLGTTSCAVRGSLFENNSGNAMVFIGSEAVVEGSVVRDTQLAANGKFGRGISIQRDPDMGTPSVVTVRDALVERNHDIGVYVSGSEATVERTLVRDTQPVALGGWGLGIYAQPSPTTSTPSTVTVRASSIERNHEVGMGIAGSQATIEATVVRDTQPNAEGKFGRGIDIESDASSGVPSAVTVRSSLIETNHDAGILVGASDATVVAVVVRDTQSSPQGQYGRGIVVEFAPATGAASTAEVRASRVERNRDIGILVDGGDASVVGSLVTATMPREADGLFGDGLVAVFEGVSTSVAIDASRIEDSPRGGVCNFGALMTLGNMAIGCAAFALERETHGGQEPLMEDHGGNGCGCPAANGPCAAVSAGLEAPESLPPAH